VCSFDFLHVTAKSEPPHQTCNKHGEGTTCLLFTLSSRLSCDRHSNHFRESSIPS